jgi:hypothetical protein
MTIWGYARVSSESQDYERQVEALKAAGAEEVLAEKMTGANADRPQLTKLMASLRAGDVVLGQRSTGSGAAPVICSTSSGTCARPARTSNRWVTRCWTPPRPTAN